MKYLKEKDFILAEFKNAFNKFYFNNPAQDKKSDFDVVTKIDKDIEKYLIKRIEVEFPGDVVISEETHQKVKIGVRTRVIDPIDGTFNMARGSKIFGCQCALIVDNELVMSIVYAPFLNEEYYAIKGEGAYKNGVKIPKFNGETPLSISIIDFGDFPHSLPEILNKQLIWYQNIIKSVGKIRMFGAACLEFSFLATHLVDAYIIPTRNLWDLLPGLLIAKECGAIISNLKGEPYKFGDLGVIAANSEGLHRFLVENISSE